MSPPPELPYAGSPPPRPPRFDWRREVMSWSGLNVLAGIWLIISPFVLDYSPRDAAWNPIVFGAIVLVLAFARFAGAFRAAGLSAINAAIGIWLFVSAWWLPFTIRAAWNVGILGVLVFLFAVFSMTATEEALDDGRL